MHQEVLEDEVDDAAEGVHVEVAREVGVVDAELLLGFLNFDLEVGAELNNLFEN